MHDTSLPRERGAPEAAASAADERAASFADAQQEAPHADRARELAPEQAAAKDAREQREAEATEPAPEARAAEVPAQQQDEAEAPATEEDEAEEVAAKEDEDAGRDEADVAPAPLAKASAAGSAASETKGQPATKPARRKRKLWKIVLFSLLALVIVAGVIGGVPLYRTYSAQYQRDMGLVHSALQHLQSAEELLKGVTQGGLNAQDVARAQQEFNAAHGELSILQRDLNGIPSIAESVPKYGSLLGAARRVIPLALEVSQAGALGCDALGRVATALHNPLDTKAPGLTQNDLNAIGQDLDQVQAIFSSATVQISQLRPADLQVDPRLQKAVGQFRSMQGTLTTGLQNVQVLLNEAPALLGIGRPGSYLVELLDSTELRPGGGFIGNYGIVSVNGGRLSGVHMADTYLLDNNYINAGHHIAIPPAYQWFPLSPDWGLRDSNLEADFPTSARYAEQLYLKEGGKGPLQGVVAITPVFIQDMLAVTGPIYVDEYHETVTAQNMIDRIHYHQLKEDWYGGDTPSPDGHSSLRKRFTELLFEHFLARLKQVAPAHMGQLIRTSLYALQTKDLQLYLNAPHAEALLQKYGLGATIQQPAGDSLFVVDANIISNKANYFIKYKLQDRVSIDAQGNAVHHTELIYTWPVSRESQQNNYGSTTTSYRDYVRVYAPPGARLQSQSGWDAQGASKAFGRGVWSGIFTLDYGHTGVIRLTWTSPHAASADAHGWHYRYLLQKQAGTLWQTDIQIALPSGAHLSASAGGLRASSAGSLAFAQPLATDLSLGADYVP